MERNNYDPNIWGKHTWLFIETSILSYPNNPNDDIKKYYYNFFESLIYILPCDDCRKHYKTFFNNNKLNNNILSSRENMIDWIIKCHNNINHINNKQIITKNNFMDYYNNLYKNKCNKCKINNNKCKINNNNKYYNLIYNFILILIFLLIIYYYKINN